jgi:DNA-binding response OmpR family regulator/rhodanese-related sulfurtransferase
MNENERTREDGKAAKPFQEGDAPWRGTGDLDPTRRAFFVNLRHELRTPLSAILGYSEMLLEDAEELGLVDMIPDAGRIQAGGRQLLKLVNEFLDPERLDAGDVEREGERFLSEVCYRLRTPLNGVLGYTELLLETAEELDCQGVKSHLRKLHGAAAEFLAFVEQADGFPGNGRMAGGAEEKLSSGHALAEDVVNTMRASTGARTPGLLEKAVILVVDDYEMNREVLSNYLERCGCTVVVAEDGLEALYAMEAHEVDLVLLDIMLPGMNGYSLLKQMKRERSLRDIPVIMISALDERDSVLRCIEIGAEDYVIKPFEPDLLRARVEACLEKKKAHDSEVRELSRELDGKSHALEDAAEELEAGFRKIEVLEEKAQRMKSAIEREAERSRRVSVIDILLILGFGLVLSLLFNAANPGGVPLVPESWSYPIPPTAATEDARQKLDGQGAVFVDARPAAYYERGHIPGALNVTLPLFEFVYLMKFARLDPGKEIIVYGRDFSRLHDRDVALKFQSRGHTDVKVLDDFSTWKERGYPIEP